MSSGVQPEAKKRRLRPRATSAISVAPLAVSDLTCAAIVGLDPRPFRAFLVAARIPHSRLGRRVVARVEDVLAAIGRTTEERGEDALVDDEQPQTADELLRSLGMKRAG